MAKSSIYQMKVTLKDTHPPIWRRIQVSGDITLFQLHKIIQIAIGWSNSHLHSFTVNGQDFGDPEDDELGIRGTRNEMRYRLNQVSTEEGDRFTYIYDFGDDWEHTILVEKIMPPEEGIQYPRCIKGKRACPPEDVGGTWGYEGFLESYFDPKNPDHESSVEWLGEGFDPEAFELDRVNAQLSRLTAGRERADSSARPAEADDSEDGFDFYDEDEDYDLWTPDWEEQPPEEYLQLVEKLPFRQDAITFLTYIRDHKVTGTKSTGNLPLKAVRELVDLLHLTERAGEDLPEYRSEEDVWPLYFVHLLTAGAGLVDGGVSQQWVLTDLGVRFLAAPAIDQISHLAYNWYLDTENQAILPETNEIDIAEEDMPAIHLEAILQMPLQEPVPVASLVPQILGVPDQAWQELKATDLGEYMRLSVEMMVLIPLASLGIIKPGFSDEPAQAGAQTLAYVELNHYGRELLVATRDAAEEDI